MPQFINLSKIYLYLLTLSCFIYACAEKTEVIETVNEDGNTERYTRFVKDYAKEGLYTLTSANGIKLEEANYTRDTLNGKRILFYESGDTLSIESYVMGIFDGPYREYYSTGNMKSEGTYEGNKMKDKWASYYPNGQVKEIVTFENNEENGPFIEYYQNGNLKAEGSYLNGDSEHGPLSLYNEAGELMRKMECNKGICRTLWLSESVVNKESTE